MTDATSHDGVYILPDERRITYRCYGAPAGLPVLALHGTPGSRLKFTATDAPARELGLRIVAPDRWGYGRTSAHRRPSLRAYCDDMTALLDHLGYDAVSIVGVSGGGPYAAALGVHLGARAAAVALVSPVGQIVGGAAGVPRLSLFHRFCFRGLPRVPRATRAIFASYGWLLRRNAEFAMRVAFLLAPGVDKQLIRDVGIRSRLAATFVEGLRPGATGPVTDMTIFGRAWDLPLHDSAAQFGVWIGTRDGNVPIGAALQLARSLPGCELNVLEGEGHLWIACHYRDVLEWVAAKQKGGTKATP